MVSPSSSYPVHRFSVDRPSSTSSLVTHRPDRPLTWAERLSKAASNQPQRRERPVVTPFSAPTVLMW